jgi:hypothetical protein
MPHTMHLLSFLFLGLLGFLQLVPTAAFELAVGPNWQPDSSGGQRTLRFPFHRVTKLVGLSRRLRRHLGRTSRRPTQGDSASRSPALPFPLFLRRGRRAWPLSRLWAVKLEGDAEEVLATKPFFTPATDGLPAQIIAKLAIIHQKHGRRSAVIGRVGICVRGSRSHYSAGLFSSNTWPRRVGLMLASLPYRRL